jgi:pseudouridine-5'-phosphate glycosidase
LSEVDFVKEQIAYLKVWLGILVVTDISLVGWLASNITSASTILIAAVVVASVIATMGIVFLHRRIEQRIESLRGL